MKRQNKIKHPQSESARQTQFLPPGLKLFIIGFLFIAAFGIRLYNINGMPRNLHPGRPYHSIIITRAYYFENSKSIPEWRREVARASSSNKPFQEPRVIEHMAAFVYRITGGEHLWAARTFFSIFWLIGGVALYVLAKRISSAEGAMFSLAFYLFLPYGVSVSRCFQPHPFVIWILIISWLQILRYYEQPSVGRVTIAAACSALTLLVYPHTALPTFAAFSVMALYKYGPWKAINLKSLLFTVIALGPVVLHYVLFAKVFIRSYAKISYTPGLLWSSFFWYGWFNQIKNVIGFAALIGGLLGIFMFRKKLAKALLTGLWIGYFVYALIFNYQAATHTYYQIPFIPIVSLSLAPIGTLIMGRLGQTCTRWYRQVPLFAFILLGFFINIHRIQQKLINPDFDRQVEIAKEIGETVGHSTKTILLTKFHNLPFQYHGEISGNYWPKSGDFRANIIRGERIPPAEERFNTIYLKDSPEYFIVTDFREFFRQTDLKNFLTQNFSLLINNQKCLIFDLRKTARRSAPAH